MPSEVCRVLITEYGFNHSQQNFYLHKVQSQRIPPRVVFKDCGVGRGYLIVSIKP